MQNMYYDAPSGLRFIERGLEPYQQTYDAMRAFTAQRGNDTIDEVWFVEHPSVFTLGQAADPMHVLIDHSAIPLVQTDRGGQVTYHGPGQMVVYFLLDLNRRRLFPKELVHRLETAMIDTLAAFGVVAERREKAPGIYIAHAQKSALLPSQYSGAKIGSIGLKISQGKTYHGISLNVDMDLSPFALINPCGYANLMMVDMVSLGCFPAVDQEVPPHKLDENQVTDEPMAVVKRAFRSVAQTVFVMPNDITTP